MPAPRNPLKAAMRRGEVQTGLWLGLAYPDAAEMADLAGFKWCVIDGEHGPNDLRSIKAQLQVMRRTHPVVRVPMDQPWLLKMVLDIGAQSVLVPMVDTAAEAAACVRAVRYPPEGMRGAAPAVVRASGWNTEPDYMETANAEICLIVQAESAAAVSNLDAILAVEGVDGVFIGPADLAADMGYPGNLDAPEVLAAVEDAVQRIVARGKFAGIIGYGPEQSRRLVGLGLQFLGIGSDTFILAQGMRDIFSEYSDL